MSETWREVAVVDLRDWFKDMREDLQEAFRDDPRNFVVEWWAAPAREIEARLRDPALRSGLNPGRPMRIRSLADAPEAWGLYRIHLKADDSWYVGISSNLRARLRSHSSSGFFALAAQDVAEVIPAKGPDKAVVVWGDLQRAEVEHIERLRARGCTVLNSTKGGNGRAPKSRFNAAEATLGAPGTRSRLRSPRPQHIDLLVRLLGQEQDWDLWLRDDDVICAIPGSHGSEAVEGETLPWDDVVSLYRNIRGGDLQDDLTARGRPIPVEPALPVLYWNGDDLAGHDGKAVLRTKEAVGLSSDEVRRRTLPAELQAEGLKIDESRGRHSGLNIVIRVHGDDTTALWAKTEENKHAVRAEILYSAVLSLLEWPGIRERSKSNPSGSVVIVPELGSGDVEDRGSFSTVFRFLRDETHDTLQCPRPQSIKRVSLSDLRLRDPNDALRLLILDAVMGNSDRHRENLHLGYRDGPGTSQGFLLPIDHGRCLLNSDPSRPGDEPGDPASVVTGRTAYSNANQLLRPVSELISIRYARSVEASTGWLVQLLGAATELLESPGWSEMRGEIELVRRRAEEVGAGIELFLDTVTEVVIP